MTSYLMTWKESGWPHSNIVDMAHRFARDGYVDESWRIYSHRQIRLQDNVWLLRQGKRPHGIFGFGSVTGTPYRGPRGDGKDGWLVRVRFTRFSDPEEDYLISENAVRSILSPDQIRARASGYAIANDQDKKLKTLLAQQQFDHGPESVAKPRINRSIYANENWLSKSLRIKWIGNDSINDVDLIPIEWLAAGASLPKMVHDVYVGQEVYKAQCDVRCRGNIAEFDYSVYSAFNRSQKVEMLLGITRVHFADSSFSQPMRVQWADKPGQSFRNYPDSKLSIVDELVDDVSHIKGRRDIKITTRSQLIDARLGQGRFREDVMSRWQSACAVTGVTIGAVLRASHIKPWRNCDDGERLSPTNGLLLCANLDALFDRYLITFSSNGELMVCHSIDLTGLNVPKKLRRPLDEAEDIFMEHHRRRTLGEERV